jgi:hypothetical protein
MRFQQWHRPSGERHKQILKIPSAVEAIDCAVGIDEPDGRNAFSFAK